MAAIQVTDKEILIFGGIDSTAECTDDSFILFEGLELH